MSYAMPREVSARMLSQQGRPGSPEMVPMELTAEMLFDGDVSAGFYCSFLTGDQQWVNISGTHGSIQITDFVLPNYGSEVSFDLIQNQFAISGCQFNMENHTRRIAVNEYSNNAVNAQETQLFRRFAELALSGSPDPHWGEIALKTQVVLDACLDSARHGGRVVKVEA
jgi:predicted dehydrogenase